MRITHVRIRSRAAPRGGRRRARDSQGRSRIPVRHLPLPLDPRAEAWRGASSRVSPRPWMSIMWGKVALPPPASSRACFSPLAPGPCVCSGSVSKVPSALLAHAKTRIRLYFDSVSREKCDVMILNPVSRFKADVGQKVVTDQYRIRNCFQSLFQTPANKTLRS